jgi:glycosyltransferase involved in cell wall biosynthesis
MNRPAAEAATLPRISVCVCTYQRPRMLARLLDALAQQQTLGRFVHEVVVADNDPAESARAVVADFRARSPLIVTYGSEARKNIALARNEALRHATGDFAAFIDDDEFPEPDWLLRMLDTCEKEQCAGVLGPVRPHFELPPPSWVVKGGFCERPEHHTGRVMHWEDCRTGNVLFRRSIIAGDSHPFLEQFGTGGEDKDFFMRMAQRGHVFRWCNEGIAYETVPPDRWTRQYMLKRALLRGNNILKHPGQRLRLLAKSALAAPAYSLLLPLTLPFGQHVFMRYCIRLCDHAGRLLGAVGLNPIKAR